MEVTPEGIEAFNRFQRRLANITPPPKPKDYARQGICLYCGSVGVKVMHSSRGLKCGSCGSWSVVSLARAEAQITDLT